MRWVLGEWCPGADLNHRHEDFQSTALPLSYPGTGDEYASSGRGVLGFDRSACKRENASSSNFFNANSDPHDLGILGPLLPRPKVRLGLHIHRSSTFPNPNPHIVWSRKGDRFCPFLFHKLGRPLGSFLTTHRKTWNFLKRKTCLKILHFAFARFAIKRTAWTR